VARADDVARGVRHDLQHVVIGSGRRHRTGGVGERAQRIAHLGPDRIRAASGTVASA
jgi:hypothetical protein